MKAIIITFLSLSIIFSTSFTHKHKFYMSVTDIEYNFNNKSLELAIQTFTDDLELALEEESNEIIRLGTDKEHKDTDKYIESYLNKNIKISIDGVILNNTFLGKEVEVNETYCYIEITNVEDFKKIEITNKLLMSTFEDQKNMINIRKGKKKGALFLKGNKSTGSVSF